MSIHPRDTLLEKVSLLERENEFLRAEVAQLKADRVSPDVLPRCLRLSGAEETILSALYRHGERTKDQLYSALYAMEDDDAAHMKIIDVFICKIRKKIAPYGLSIDTIWGRGYTLPRESAAALKALVQTDVAQLVEAV